MFRAIESLNKTKIHLFLAIIDKWLSDAASIVSIFPQSKLYVALFEKFEPRGAEILQNFHGSK